MSTCGTCNDLFVALVFWEVKNLYHFFGHSKASREDLYRELQKIFFMILCGEGRDSKGLSQCGKSSGIEAFNLDDI
jgi:hypothetical protein